ncbi:hypothetical protein [Pseudobacteroides cellulosolvens]|uniref:Uncharacterized protein n=1 Tax=Pseudobacteroides cellulosolvens ATCC 35603 = DSM 2933 TaxID=398512 RepID=A0A0L6JSX0_9FIRM|nr:hypothetical protein [Pseudobacteroides cellulosolvens]KNY28913.1 hypothetical protein Bccel_4187 [Pseudobacteroides cellulosolvens ATCC 35603 = DSM 2933]
MNEQEFLNGVHMKINLLQYERDMLEIIQEKQKRHLYRKIKTCCTLFSAILGLIIYAVIFSIDLGFLVFTSVVLLIISVCAENSDFEVKDIEMGVRENGYSYK